MGDEQRREETQAAPVDDRRCTLCGASRIMKVLDDGRVRFGACSLVPGADGTGGCKDPTFDADVEKARAALGRLYKASKRVPVVDYDGDPEVDYGEAFRMLGLGGPRRRT